MTSLIHPCPKRALIPLKFEVIFNYDTYFKVAQSYPHGPKLAQLTVQVEDQIKTTEVHFKTAEYHIKTVGNQFNPCSAGGGAKGPPCGFSQIAPEVLGISLWNLSYLSGQQFHTVCQKIRTQVIIGQKWVTSEWRHVSPILTEMGLRESPPLVQF